MMTIQEWRSHVDPRTGDVRLRNKKTNERMNSQPIDAREYIGTGEWELDDGSVPAAAPATRKDMTPPQTAAQAAATVFQPDPTLFEGLTSNQLHHLLAMTGKTAPPVADADTLKAMLLASNFMPTSAQLAEARGLLPDSNDTTAGVEA